MPDEASMAVPQARLIGGGSAINGSLALQQPRTCSAEHDIFNLLNQLSPTTLPRLWDQWPDTPNTTDSMVQSVKDSPVASLIRPL